MSGALEGEHLCLKHQGNHSHYADHNCTICKLKKRIELYEQIKTIPPKEAARLQMIEKAVLDDRLERCQRCSDLKIMKTDPLYDRRKGHTCFDGWMTCPIKDEETS
jgi:hypothetical protein